LRLVYSVLLDRKSFAFRRRFSPGTTAKSVHEHVHVNVHVNELRAWLNLGVHVDVDVVVVVDVRVDVVGFLICGSAAPYS